MPGSLGPVFAWGYTPSDVLCWLGLILRASR